MDSILPLVGIAIGWALKSLADYFVFRQKDRRTYNASTFFLLRAWKLLKDYERGTAYFRKSKPEISDFEKWRAILAKRYTDSYSINASTISDALNHVSQVDPIIAARLDNTFRNLEFSFHAKWNEISQEDPERYAALIYNQDELVDIALIEIESVAHKLSGRSGVLERFRTYRYFRSINTGTKDFNAGLEEQGKLIDKVIGP